MEPALQDQPIEKDAKPAFRKPVNDASSRRYRRHSPGAGSDASSVDDEKPGRTRDYASKQDESQKVYKKRNDDEADRDRDYYSKSRRSSESYKQPDRYSSGSAHGYHRHDDYGNRGYRDADRDDRNYRRPSQSSRDVRDNNSSSHSRREHTHERHRENPRSGGDRYSRDKSDSGYRIKDKDRDGRQYLNDNDGGPQRRHVSSLNDSAKALELERHKERGVRDDRREHHRGGADGSKNDLDNASSHRRESMKEGQDNSSSKRKHDEIEYKKHRDAHSEEEEDPKNGKSFANEHEREKRNAIKDEPLPSKLKSTVEDENPRPDREKTSKFSTEPGVFSAGQVDVVPDVGAAKFAAMKAAEIVNRNLIGGGLSTTEQKKKLLWGNKKTTATEESTSQWDLSLFPDRERQEKFKKLMGVKGDLKMEPKPEDQDGTLRAEKRKELEMDLEKQYTAGLRRRDGRTVGLGL